MNLDARAGRLRAAVAATLVVLATANAVLTVALVREATARKQVVVVPGARVGRESPANEPPPEAVRDFAILYLAHFDTYTPATVDEVTRTLQGWLSPRFFTQAAAALEKRRELVAQSRMASQLLLPRREEAVVRPTGESEYEISLSAVRRVYIADRLQSENALTYTVAVEAGTPTLGNPYGLYVTGQLIAPKEPQRAPDAK